MEIFALSGPSGSGKSTIALSFAHEKKIPAIIDDGLLIINGQRVAGTSAKYEKNAVTAVKRATFHDRDHAQEVRLALAHYFITRLLIIGTSDRMVKLIANNLQLGEIKQYYHIENIRSSGEIKIAQFIRKTEGKHVIPIPYKQVEQSLFKKVIHRGVDIFSKKKEHIGETTIVYPDFHRSSIHIYKKAYKDMVTFICLAYENIKDCKSVHIDLEGPAILHVTIGIHYPLNENLIEMTKRLQKDIFDQFLNYLGLELYSIRMRVQMG